MKKDNKKAKKAIYIVLLVLAVLACVILAAYSASGFISRKLRYDRMNEKPSPLNGGFYPIDFNADIEGDEEYLNKNRYISYTDESGAVTETITDGNYADFGQDLVFFDKYFTTLRNGDYENYDKLFTRSYFSTHEHTDTELGFTKQRIYNIHISYCKPYKANGVENTIYEVVYCIFKNDGLFRNDIRSDEYRALYFTLSHTKDGVLISDIAYGYDYDFDYDGSSLKDEVVAAVFAVIILAAVIITTVIVKKKGKKDGREAS